MKQTEVLTHVTHVNGWFPAVYMSCMSQNFRLFHASNLSVQNFQVFLLMYPGSVWCRLTLSDCYSGCARDWTADEDVLSVIKAHGLPRRPDGLSTMLETVGSLRTTLACEAGCERTREPTAMFLVSAPTHAT